MNDSNLIFAGIDGGGTRTRLLLTRGDGTLLGFAEGGCCSFVELGRERAAKVFSQLWLDAWKSAGSSPCLVDALFIGTGSILSAADAQTNCEIALGLGLVKPGRVHADNDAGNGLAGALGGRPGLLLIAGTGSVCQGRNARGESWRAGGWGHLLNDTGSAYALGLAAMVAVTQAADGRGPRTGLTAVITDALALRDLREIYRKVHEDGMTRAEIAALAPRIVALAEEGDTVAGNILDNGTEGLAEMVVAVARHLGLEKPELALTGGLIENAASYRKRLLDRLAARLPGFTVAGDGFPPVFGAVMLACEAATGHPPTPEFLKNLRQIAAALEAKA